MTRPKIGFFEPSVLKRPSSLSDDTIFHIAAEVDESQRKVRYVPYTVRVSESDTQTLRNYIKQGERFTHQSSQLGPYITAVPAFIVQAHKINSLDAAQHLADRLFHEHTVNNNHRNILFLAPAK